MDAVLKLSLRALAVLLTIGALPFVSARAEPSIFPTGVTRYDPARAYNSYILFSTNGRTPRLIDMNGDVIRTWDYSAVPAVMLDPALTHGEKGHILLQLSRTEGTAKAPGGGAASGLDVKTVGELDWDGRTVWEWGETAPGGAAQQHHDIRRLPNGDTLVLAMLQRHVDGFARPMQSDDVIYEVDAKGKIVWRWLASEHLGELGFTAAELQLVRATRTADYLHVNDMAPLGPNHWFDAGDKRFDPANIIFCSREANFTAIINKKTGRIVWEIGPDYPSPPGLARGPRPVPRPVDQISGQHDGHMIAEGLPGAGDILIFDDQGGAGYPPAPLDATGGSRVIEINPVTKQIVWQYDAQSSGMPAYTFYSGFISSARRLPNGNTLIDEGINGRFFQVTPAGDIVWEYVNSYFESNGPGRPRANWAYRAQPVPYDWIPAGAPRSERPVTAPDNAKFRVP